MGIDLSDKRTIAGLSIVMAGLLIVVALLVLGGDEGGGPIAGSSPTPTVSPTPSQGETPSASPSPTETSPSPSPSATLPPALGAQGAILTPAGAANDPRPLIGDDCAASFHDPQYDEVGCNKITMGGGDVYWVVMRRFSEPGTAFLVHIRRYAPAAGAWVVALKAKEAAGSWSDVDVFGRDITGSGKLNVFVAVRLTGSGANLAYDVLSWPNPGSTLKVRFHRGLLNKGTFKTSPSGIDEYGANFDDGAPNCCPTFYDHVRIEFVDGEFRVVEKKKIPTDQVPEGESQL